MKLLGAEARAEHRRWLLELTGIPTAAGREQGVIDWITRWVRARTDLTLRADGAGNLVIRRRAGGGGAARPLFITAHMDHPAFVVRGMIDERRAEVEFRGGVLEPYFNGAAIEIVGAGARARRAILSGYDRLAVPYPRAVARLAAPGPVPAGAIGRWAFTGRGRTPVVSAGKLYAHACDDLAGVAGALAALDAIRRRKDACPAGVLLTRAEEIGFVGAIAACRRRTVPGKARVICLENSRSFAESPIGGGPILRVGDKATVFSPALTNRVSTLTEEYKALRPGFKAQRRLMPGGTCEASTFAAYGYEATCVCLPLGNYHNMVDIDRVSAGKRPARVGPEYIAVEDFHGMVELLVWFAMNLHGSGTDPFRQRMERLYRMHRAVLSPVTPPPER
jgi:endoglucanase